MITTWSNEESDSSSQSKNQEKNLCLMAHHGNSIEVTSKTEHMSNEQWEEPYETLYEKFKTLRHENKLLKKQCASQNDSNKELKKIDILIAEIDTLKNKKEGLKNENDSLKSTNNLLEIDFACLIDKISTLVKEVDDLKFTLARFVKGKNTLDTILGIKVNF